MSLLGMSLAATCSRLCQHELHSTSAVLHSQQVISRFLWLQSLDSSCEVPVYVLKLGGALHRVVQHNDAEVQLVRLDICFSIPLVIVT